MANCLIACGSNQGDRNRWLNAAVEQLDAASGTRVIRHSPWLETPAVGRLPRSTPAAIAAATTNTATTAATTTAAAAAGAPAAAGSTADHDLQHPQNAERSAKAVVAQSAVQKAADYLNGAILVNTTLTPLELLHVTQQIEARLGRAGLRERERWGARTIDLDLLLYDDQVILIEPAELCELTKRRSVEPQVGLPMARLEIPHPRVCYRRFVLDPACAVAGDWQHPLVPFTLQQLRQRLKQSPTIMAITSADVCGAARTPDVERIVRQAADELSVRWRSLPNGLYLLQAATSPQERSCFEPSAIPPAAQLLVILADLPLQMTAQPAALSGQSGESGNHAAQFNEPAGFGPAIPRIYVSMRDPGWVLREVTAAWTAMQSEG